MKCIVAFRFSDLSRRRNKKVKKSNRFIKNHPNRLHEIYDSFYNDKKEELISKAYERNSNTK